MFPRANLDRDRTIFSRDIQAIWKSAHYSTDLSLSFVAAPIKRHVSTPCSGPKYAAPLFDGPSQRLMNVDGPLMVLDGAMLSNTAEQSSCSPTSHKRYTSAISQSMGEVTADGYAHFLRWGQWTQSRPRSQLARMTQDNIFYSALCSENSIGQVDDGVKPSNNYVSPHRPISQFILTDSGHEDCVCGGCSSLNVDLDPSSFEEITDEYITSLNLSWKNLQDIANFYTSEKYVAMRSTILLANPLLVETPINRYRRKIVNKIIDYVLRRSDQQLQNPHEIPSVDNATIGMERRIDERYLP